MSGGGGYGGGGWGVLQGLGGAGVGGYTADGPVQDSAREQEHQSLQRLQQASDGQLHAQLIEQHKAAPASLDAGIIAQSNAKGPNLMTPCEFIVTQKASRESQQNWAEPYLEEYNCCESAAVGQAEMVQVEIWYVQLQLVHSGMHEPRNNAAALRLVHSARKRVKVSQQRVG
ncbi:MAG: hypothetical protein FRX49_13066 [Trebouxia sp. A1-2]|nr:MAG: hypothetical protein FRX49_13066 [Trebouxia sp. A1-2]